MDEGKDPKLAGLEQSLINFLCRRKDIEEKVPGGERRVRSLSIHMDYRNRNV